MKKTFKTLSSIALATIASIALVFSASSCTKDDNGKKPEITWAANPSFKTVEITKTMDVTLKVTAPAGITGFRISVTSPDTAFKAILDAMVSKENKSANNEGNVVLDLINDDLVVKALAVFGVPTGNSLVGKTEVNVTLSNLVPLIGSVAQTEGEYIFNATVTDADEASTTKKLTFHLTKAE